MRVTRAMFDGLASTVSCVCAPGILVVLAVVHVLLSWIYLKGQVMRCATPAHFTADLSEYIHSACAGGASLHLPYDEFIPDGQADQLDFPYIHVCRYVALIFLLQAVLYFLPAPIWSHLCRRSGINIDDVITLAKKALLSGNADERRAVTKETAVYVMEYTTSHRQNRLTSCVGRCWHGNRLFFSKMFILLLQTLNAIGQFYMVSCLVGGSFAAYGFKIKLPWLTREDQGNDTQLAASLYLPKIVLCDVNIRQLGSVHQYTSQCQIATSAMDEYFFLMTWFVMLVVAIVTSVCLFRYLVGFSLTAFRGLDLSDFTMDVNRHHSAAGVSDANKINISRQKKAFVTELLQRDGLFLFEKIADGASSVMAERVLLELWQLFSDDILSPAVQVSTNVPMTDYTAVPSGKYDAAEKATYEEL